MENIKQNNNDSNSILDIKIRLWEYIQNYIIDLENRQTRVVTITMTALSAIVTYGIVNDNPEILYAVPIIILVLLNYFSNITRLIATLGGYAWGLEEVINKKLNKNIYLWNSVYTQDFKHINRPGELTILLTGFVGIVLIIVSFIIILDTSDLLFWNLVYIVITCIITLISIILLAPYFQYKKDAAVLFKRLGEETHISKTMYTRKELNVMIKEYKKPHKQDN